MKKYILITLFLSLIFISFTPAQAITTIVEDYPKLPACYNNEDCKPGDENFGLPQFINYIFQFALGAVGVIGLIALISAAFGYVMSAGNPQKASDAKDSIVSALLGLLLLLGSVVLLNLINPDLLKLKLDAKPISIDIPPADPSEDKCRFERVSWDKKIINAGESATLTFKYSSECSGKKIYPNDHKGLYLLQVGGAEDWFRNHRCAEPWSIDQDNLTYSTICAFKKVDIENVEKGKPETFILEGYIKLDDVEQKLDQPLYIIVRDLYEDGDCCK